MADCGQGLNQKKSLRHSIPVGLAGPYSLSGPVGKSAGGATAANHNAPTSANTRHSPLASAQMRSASAAAINARAVASAPVPRSASRKRGVIARIRIIALSPAKHACKAATSAPRPAHR